MKRPGFLRIIFTASIFTFFSLSLLLADLNNDLIKAVKSGSLSMVKKQIAAGAKVSFVEKKYGWTPLHIAVMKGYTSMIRLLVKHKADSNLHLL